ncbi:adenylate cyclase [Mariprofundus micogutta]|uniref:Adenylate cyclase n=1 Tax=Mariprofundus micogutta TaxID=1921010 RepID=A0A1L8CN92_9PROT|nr:adenylate/guanylate cyclase domain-containing protein [Mariprofundus micogutta]GAV20381.1 adenylate cyclase [Mariprofundus micogutta]
MSLRMLWSLFTIILVAVVAVVMMASIAEIEKRAWKDSEQQQAKLLITLLSDELKMPMVAGSTAEVDTLIKMFKHRVPGTSVFLRWASGHTESFSDSAIPDEIEAVNKLPGEAAAIEGQDRWYGMGVNYNTTQLGTISMYFPGKSWRENDLQIKMNLTATAASIALLAALLVYGLSGRTVNQLRMLARGSKRLGSGDYSVHLPIRSSNEFGKAFNQFNLMVSSLEQREKVYDLYGRYQRPQLVADEYDRNTFRSDHLSREVSVLAIDMIAFNAYAQQSRDDELIPMLNRIFALFQQIIQEFGGHVDQISGDKMIALFNHPFDLKCHENQAVKAGLAVIQASENMALKRPDGGHVGFRVGMAIGEVSVGHLGVGRRKEFTVIGEPLSLAAQIAKIGDAQTLTAQYGTMLALGHGFKQKELGQKRLPNGRELRCISILAGEAYVNQEIDEVLAKALVRAEPDDMYEDEGW